MQLVLQPLMSGRGLWISLDYRFGMEIHPRCWPVLALPVGSGIRYVGISLETTLANGDQKGAGVKAKILRDELFRNMTRDGGILLLGLGT